MCVWLIIMTQRNGGVVRIDETGCKSHATMRDLADEPYSFGTWLEPTVGGSELKVELTSTPSFVLRN